MKSLSTPRIVLIGLLLLPMGSDAQLRRPGVVMVDREDRSKSKLVKEEGAVYLEGMVEKELVVGVSQGAAVYSSLKGDRWMGNLIPAQTAVLLAVSDKAYRVRAKAKQGQISGWVSKSAITGIPEGFEARLREYYERYVIVSELIENHQVALGMTVAEVIAAIGPPDKRNSTVNAEGRSDSLEYISYERVPQTVMTFNSFGQQVPMTQYIEVESGRVQIGFQNDMVNSISESEGLNFANSRASITVPPPIFLF